MKITKTINFRVKHKDKKESSLLKARIERSGKMTSKVRTETKEISVKGKIQGG
jgi:hypothetical protein